MNFTAIAIDDEVFALKDLELQLASLPQLNLQATFNNVLDALKYFVDNASVDLIFLDICMERIQGLEGATLLSQYCDLLLFTTGHPQYALDAFKVGADAFLIKPIHSDEVKVKLAKLTKLRTKNGLGKTEAVNTKLGSCFVRNGTKKEAVYIDLNKIMLIRCNGNYVDVVTDKTTVTAHMSLNKAEERLCKTDSFIRINQSVIVAKDAISDLTEGGIILTNKLWYPIGRIYHKRFHAFYKQDLF